MPAMPSRRGFTLIELLLALTIFSLAMAMAGGSLWSILRAWRRGGEMLDSLHYGEYVLSQLEGAVRSAAWFPSKPETFGFVLEDDGGTSDSAANRITFTTGSGAFLPADSPLAGGLHRLSIAVSGSGESRGLVATAYPHMADAEDLGLDRKPDREEIPVSLEVYGFSCEWYDFEEEDWSQDWEETNSLPKLVRLNLVMKPREGEKDRLKLSRVVELAVAPDLPGRERRSSNRRGDSAFSRRREEAEGGGGDSSRVPPSGGGGGRPGGGFRPGGGGGGGRPGGGGTTVQIDGGSLRFGGNGTRGKEGK
jgi:prepilin-type N-terminal cleavage/methylation domain-containing protein